MKLGKFITTLGVGAALGMLFAPKKGSELRDELKVKGLETYDKAKSMTKEEFQDLVNKSIDEIKKAVDEFDVDEFKGTTTAKLNGVKSKLEELSVTVQNSDEFAQVKDALKKVSDDVTARVDELKVKVKEKDFSAFKSIEESIEDIEEEIVVILDDLKD